jgi:chemotaxis protein methyltransferase CheR
MVEDNAAQYLLAGGRARLADYFTSSGGTVRVSDALRDHVAFSHHNLVSDGVFCRADLVICRNVLIYFDRQLQDRVLGVFGASLSEGGFLCLGDKENVVFSAVAPLFKPLDSVHRLYRRH